MQTIMEFLGNLTNPEWIMQHGGLYIVVLIIFIETGLFFGFFLPGDSLLFIVGMIIANTLAPFTLPLLNLCYWIALIAAAGVLGNYVGYWFGKKSDRLLFRRDNWLFKQKYLVQAKAFYDKKGGYNAGPLSSRHPHFCTYCGRHGKNEKNKVFFL
jgi:membrane-associated protein